MVAALVPIALAPYALEGARRVVRWVRGQSSSSEVIAALPAGWTRWGGARPELTGVPAGSILCVQGIAAVGPEVRAALLQSAQALGIPADALASIIASESGWQTDAGRGHGAVGLIQLTLSAHLPPFTTPDALQGVADLDGVQQFVEVVVPYYARFGQKAQGADPGLLYMLNFLPAFAGQPESFVLATRENDPDGVYAGNYLAFDPQGTGRITVGGVYDHLTTITSQAGGRRICVDGTILDPPLDLSTDASGGGASAGAPGGLVAQGAAMLSSLGTQGTTAATDADGLAGQGADLLGADRTAGGPGCSSCALSAALKAPVPIPVPWWQAAGFCCESCALGIECEGECPGPSSEPGNGGGMGTAYGVPQTLGALSTASGPGDAPAGLLAAEGALLLSELGAGAAGGSPSFNAALAEVAASPAQYQRVRLAPHARAAGPGSVRGLLLAAVQSGEIDLASIAWTEVEVPALDLIVTVPLEALRCNINGQLLRVGASWADTQAICQMLGCLPPTREVVDAVWAASSPRIDGALLYVPTDGTAGQMQSIDACVRLNAQLDAAIAAAGAQPDALVRPQGKAYIVSERLGAGKGAVNYGLPRLDGTLIQPEQAGHDRDWLDYLQLLGEIVQRQARRISTGQVVDALDVYRGHFSSAVGPWLDVYEVTS
jgi:hypothetical protein